MGTLFKESLIPSTQAKERREGVYRKYTPLLSMKHYMNY